MKKKRIAVHTQYDYEIQVGQVTLMLLGTANWSNLISWLRLAHESGIGLIRIASPSGTQEHVRDLQGRAKEAVVIAGLFRVVDVMLYWKWDQVKETLDLLRYGLMGYDSTWGVE